MGTLSVRIRYRPIRFGWCVREGNIEDIRRALRLTCTLWGGRHNPLIPVGGPDDHGRELVEAFRVDALYPVTDDPSLKRFAKSFSHLPWPGFHEEFFIDGMTGRVATFLDIYHPVRFLFEKYIQDKADPKLEVRIFEWDPADPLADVLLAYFGAYPSAEDTGKDYGDFVSKNLRAQLVQLDAVDALPNDAFRAITPAVISGYDLKQDRVGGWNYPGFYVGDPADFEDILNFWNLRAANIGVLFLDNAQDIRLRGLWEAYLGLLRQRPEDPPGWDPKVCIWSREGAAVDLAKFGGERIGRVELRDGVWNGRNIQPPLMYIDEHSALGSLSDRRGVPSLSFDLRPKPFFDDPEFHIQSVIASVRPLIDVGGEETTFRYPYIPELNQYYGHKAHFESNAARAEHDGLGIVVSLTQDDLTIDALRRRELVAGLFRVFGMNAEPSEPGRIAARLIKQMGGVQGCRAFKIAGTRDLIERYSPLQSFTRTNAVQIIGRNDPETGIPHFERYERLYIEPRERGGKLTPHHVFDFLLKRGVFRVGLKFLCPSCELDFWTGLDDVRAKMTCEYCGSEFNVTPQLRDRDWAYRRSGLFGREDHQQGSIPVALTLQQLDTTLHREGISVTGMNLGPVSAAVEPCETDFVVISEEPFERKVALAIGECKTGREIEAEDVRKLTLIADALSATKRIEPYIIFSKPAPFTQDELTRCSAAQPQFGKRVILLSDRELEPHFVYELAKEEFDIPPGSSSLHDLARATDSIYFTPRRRPRQVTPPQVAI
jgi:hypothetical protein